MPRSLSNAKLLAAAINRRGYAAASHSQGILSSSFARGGSRSCMVGKVEERALIKDGSGASSAWAPDPVTGYYRPGNCAAEIDPAELREMLLNQKDRPH